MVQDCSLQGAMKRDSMSQHPPRGSVPDTTSCSAINQVARSSQAHTVQSAWELGHICPVAGKVSCSSQLPHWNLSSLGPQC